jgi:hypothetical protein
MNRIDVAMWAPAIAVAFAGSPAAAAATKTFSTPEAAVTALVEAAEKGSQKDVDAIVGTEFRNAIKLDQKDDQVARDVILRAARRQTLIEPDPDDPSRRILYFGESEWPFPAPLVKSGKNWRFDGKAGAEEIENRRIGRNELLVMAGCVGYVDAQLEYLSNDHDGDGMLEYAARINSTPGRHDGLYWTTTQGEALSPLGPFAAQAAWDEVAGDQRKPLAGYYCRVLTRQGAHARGGARNYLQGNDLVGGFGLVAWPATYGDTGIKTFIVNQLGEVFEKDLGTSTSSAVAGITVFDPDASWTRVPADILDVASED